MAEPGTRWASSMSCLKFVSRLIGVRWRCPRRGHRWTHSRYDGELGNRIYRCSGCGQERAFYVGGAGCYPEEMTSLHGGEVIVTSRAAWNGRVLDLGCLWCGVLRREA